MIDPMPGSGAQRCALAIAISFILFHIAMFGWIVPPEAWKSGGDLQSYLDPAVALYKHGRFVDLSDPTKPYVYRQPAYTTLLAGFLWLTDGQSIRAIFPLQAAMLFLTGVITWRLACLWAPRAALFAFGAILFNPNATGAAYIITPQNLLAPCFAAAAWLVLRRREGPNFFDSLAAGLVVGLSCLVRFVAQLLLLAWPAVTTILALMSGRKGRWRGALAGGFVGLGLGLSVIAPWLSYMHANDFGLTFSPPEHRLLFVNDNMAQIEMRVSGISNGEAKARIAAKREAWRNSRSDALHSLPEQERLRAEISFLIDEALKYPIGTAALALLTTWTNMFVGGGAANLQLALDIEAPRAWDYIREKRGHNYVTAFFASFSEASPAANAVSIVAIGYVLIMRLLGVLGLLVLLVRRDWSMFVSIVGICLYYAFLHLFIGESLYRVAIEPFLALSAAVGLDAVLARRASAVGVNARWR